MSTTATALPAAAKARVIARPTPPAADDQRAFTVERPRHGAILDRRFCEPRGARKAPRAAAAVASAARSTCAISQINSTATIRAV
jgi:hypothetical protein